MIFAPQRYNFLYENTWQFTRSVYSVIS